jgi:hypothetical protein
MTDSPSTVGGGGSVERQKSTRSQRQTTSSTQVLLCTSYRKSKTKSFIYSASTYEYLPSARNCSEPTGYSQSNGSAFQRQSLCMPGSHAERTGGDTWQT